MVNVTPELSSNAVLIVGSQNGVIVVKGSTMLAGEPVAPAARLGQTDLKSGHSKAFSRLPSSGTEWARTHHKALKNAPKNITSEKINQLMLQRNDKSILRPYWPPSLSPMAWLNHWYKTPKNHSMPIAKEYLPQSAPLIHCPAPRMMKKRPRAARAGCRDGLGTK